MKKFISLLLSTITILSTLVILTTSASADSYTSDELVELGPSLTLDVGKKVDLSYLFSKSDKTVNFVSSEKKVAKIVKSNGKRYVKAVGEGKAVIWAMKGDICRRIHIVVKNFKNNSSKLEISYYFTELSQKKIGNWEGLRVKGDGNGEFAMIHFKAKTSSDSDDYVSFFSKNASVNILKLNSQNKTASLDTFDGNTTIYAISSSGNTTAINVTGIRTSGSSYKGGTGIYYKYTVTK